MNAEKDMNIRAIITAVLVLLIAVLIGTASAFAYDVNTDTDEPRDDGSYTFTGDGDWYGYTSYLNNDGKEHFVSARYYNVTLPEDGRLDIELTGEQNVYFNVSVKQYVDNEATFSNEWRPVDSEKPLDFKATTGMMEKGTYVVTFGYDLSTYLGPLQTWPGKHYFYHNVTFRTFSSDEEIAFEVVKMINAIPDTITLDSKDSIIAAKAAYDNLTEAQKGTISSGTKSDLNYAVKEIEYLEKQAEEAKKQEEQSGSGDDGSSDPQGGGNDPAEWPDDQYEEPVTKPAKGAFRSVRALKKKIKVSIRPQSGAVYQLSIRRKGIKKWKTVNLNRTAYTFRKLKSGKKYQLRVCSIKTVNGYKYKGAWSKIRTVKVK